MNQDTTHTPIILVDGVWGIYTAQTYAYLAYRDSLSRETSAILRDGPDNPEYLDASAEIDGATITIDGVEYTVFWDEGNIYAVLTE